LNIDWDDVIFDYRERSRESKISTPSYSQVVKPLYKSSIYRWKNYQDYLLPHKNIVEKWLLHFEYET
jgi:hypothetical protein